MPTEPARYDPILGEYWVEPDAKITLFLENQAYGQALVTLWDAVHPNRAGVVEVTSKPEGADVVLVSASKLDTPSTWVPLDGNLVKAASVTLDSRLYKAVNAGSELIIALPVAWEGKVFAWNRTLLNRLGYNLGPLTGDNLTVAGWGLFPEADPEKPGFEAPTFLRGLEFVRAAAEAKVADFDTVAKRSSSGVPPFFLVSSPTELTDLASKGGFDLQISRGPTWKGRTWQPLVGAKVFAVRRTTPFPSAAHEFLRLALGAEGIQALVKAGAVPALKVAEASTRAWSSVFRTQAVLPRDLPVEPYAQKGIEAYFQALASGTLTPAEAQEAIVAASVQ